MQNKHLKSLIPLWSGCALLGILIGINIASSDWGITISLIACDLLFLIAYALKGE